MYGHDNVCVYMEEMIRKKDHQVVGRQRPQHSFTGSIHCTHIDHFCVRVEVTLLCWNRTKLMEVHILSIIISKDFNSFFFQTHVLLF